MPRITDERRATNRSQIVAAARRCFSRDGFHATSMPDIATEAGLSVGAPYRYFSGKDEIVVEIAGDAFALIFDPIARSSDTGDQPTVADLVQTGIDAISRGAGTARTDGDVEELLRCAVQAWSELLRHEGLREQANAGFDGVRDRIARVLRDGQQAGTVAAGLDPDGGARVVMALLHGFVLQYTAFGLDDTAGFARDVRAVLGDVEPPPVTTTTPKRSVRNRRDPAAPAR